MRRATCLLLAGLLGLVLAVLGVPSATADVTVAVRADAHVQSNAATTNYETATNMVVNDATADRYAFVKVDIPALPGGETQDGGVLRVQLNANDPAGAIAESAVITVDKVTNVWTETNLTWNDQPAVETPAVGSVAFTGNGWYDIPVGTVVPGATASYRITSSFGGFINIPSQENTNGFGPVFRLETSVVPVSNPSAVRASTTCGVLDVDYSTGAGDNQPSTFVTTVDGVTVDNEQVAPNSTGGHSATLVEDSSQGSASVVVTGNGTTLLSFEVDTDCVAPPQSTWPPQKPFFPKVFGMSAPENEWNTRLNQVGRCGIEARRIFVPNLQTSWNGKFQTIQETVADGMIPVISFKPGSGLSGFLNGQDDAQMANIRADLLSLDVPVTVTWWHEPNGDMTQAQFHQGSRRFFDIMNAPDIAVGPIINGWLLDNGVSDFTAWTTPGLMDDWEFLGTDTYQAGTDANPDASKPGGRAVPLLDDWLNDQGHPDMPIVVGEYNGWTAASIDYGGDQLRFTDNLWIGLMWNSGPTGLGKPLEGQRLAEYIEDKAAPEVLHEQGC